MEDNKAKMWPQPERGQYCVSKNETNSYENEDENSETKQKTFKG